MDKTILKKVLAVWVFVFVMHLGMGLEALAGLVVEWSDTWADPCNVPASGMGGTKCLEQAVLSASDGTRFGYSTSISGDYCIISAYRDADNGSESGAAYIFKREGGVWFQHAKLTASDGAAGDWLGYSVSIDGDYAIVGAEGDNDNGEESGSAYIFNRQGTIWVEQAKLTASDGWVDDSFGKSVAIAGDYAIVGSPYDDDYGSNSGSAYIFRREGTSWVEDTKLTPAGLERGDFFGRNVYIDGDYAAVGAEMDDDNGDNSGAVYIFKRNGVGWTEQAKLGGSDSSTRDQFGESISIDGDYCIVGTDRGDGVYVFKRDGETWVEQAKLTHPDGSDYIGSYVSIAGEYCMANIFGEGLVFKRDGTEWREHLRLNAWEPPPTGYPLGLPICLGADYCVVGAGPVCYVFTLETGSPVSLETTGPEKIASEQSACYQATVTYANNCTNDVTGLADWDVEPEEIASIEAGVLSVEEVDEPVIITISAEYVEDDIAVSAGLEVLVLPYNLYVPSDYLTIQEAIDVAVDGMSVIVADGTYTGEGNVNLSFRGKAITVRSENGPENCIVDCDGARHGFTFYAVEDSNSVLEGFTITKASHSGMDFGWGTSPRIMNCIITGNLCRRGDGAGIICDDGSSPLIKDCIISNNESQRGFGGGVYCDESGPAIVGCTIIGNRSEFGGGGIYCWDSELNITNCIMWDNRPEQILSESSGLYVTYSDVDNGWPGVGNIDAEPCFVEAGYWDVNGFWVEGDYRLLEGSPCIDSGDPNYAAGPNETDLDGKARVIDGDEDGTAVVDMGAYEYIAPLEVEMTLVPRTLSCGSKGRWVKAHIVLPEGFSAEDVDLDEPAVAEPMDVESEYMKVVGRSEGPVMLEIIWQRDEFCSRLVDSGEIQVKVVGYLRSLRRFEGTDTIRIRTGINERRRIRQVKELGTGLRLGDGQKRE